MNTEINNELKNDVLEMAAGVLRRYDDSRRKFIIGLEGDATYALEWADNFFTETANAHVWRYVQAWLQNSADYTVQIVVDELKDDVMRSYPNSSTSKCSNLIKDSTLYAKLNLIKELESAINCYKRKEERTKANGN